MYFNPEQFGPLVHQRLKELRHQADLERELRKRNEPIVQAAPVRVAVKTQCKPAM